MEQILDVEKRTKSILTGCSTEVLYTLKDFPIHMMESDKNFSSDMVFAIGKKDGFIQLENIISPEKLYIDTHFNSPGKVWENHYIAVSEVIEKYSDKPLEILEIGG